jgi:hypothetical protein
MCWIIICLLLFTLPARATELFYDDHRDRSYIFESEAKDVVASISRDDAIKKANEWAARFYKDPFIQFERIEFRIEPMRFWFVRFRHSDTGKAFYALVLPDGAIVEPKVNGSV